MITYYCPKCWQIVDEKEKNCPRCGFRLDEFLNQEYERKLLDALHHPIPERRMIAAQILGNLNVHEAVPILKEILANETEDYYFLRTVLLALAKIDHPEKLEIIEHAKCHPSTLVSQFAQELLEKIEDQKNIETWDRFSG